MLCCVPRASTLSFWVDDRHDAVIPKTECLPKAVRSINEFLPSVLLACCVSVMSAAVPYIRLIARASCVFVATKFLVSACFSADPTYETTTTSRHPDASRLPAVTAARVRQPSPTDVCQASDDPGLVDGVPRLTLCVELPCLNGAGHLATHARHTTLITGTHTHTML